MKHYTCKTGRDSQENQKICFYYHKNESTFLFLLPNIHALLVLITDSSLQPSPNIPIPKKLFSSFSVHRATFFTYSSLTEQLREPNEISNSYENSEIDPQRETQLTFKSTCCSLSWLYSSYLDSTAILKLFN